jgi:hypothetical protein
MGRESDGSYTMEVQHGCRCDDLSRKIMIETGQYGEWDKLISEREERWEDQEVARGEKAEQLRHQQDDARWLEREREIARQEKIHEKDEFYPDPEQERYERAVNAGLSNREGAELYDFEPRSTTRHTTFLTMNMMRKTCACMDRITNRIRKQRTQTQETICRHLITRSKERPYPRKSYASNKWSRGSWRLSAGQRCRENSAWRVLRWFKIYPQRRGRPSKGFVRQ